MNTSEEIGRLNERIAIYKQRSERCEHQGFSPNLWEQEILDCEIMIERLQEGKMLTREQRGLPS